MRSRLSISVCLLFCLTARVWALDFSVPQGESSFEFLKFSLSPRSTALGGAGVALVDGIADADVNPAAAARDSGDVSLGQGYFPTAAATGDYISWNIPVEAQRITVQVRYLGYNNIAGYSSLDDTTAAYGAHTLKLQAGTAGFLWGFAYGVSAAFAQNNVSDGTYEAGLFNAGLWRDLGRGVAAGASITNADFLTSKANDGSKIIPPTTVQAGLAYSREVSDGIQVSAALDARKVNDESLAFPAGIEADWRHILSARLGYPFGASGAYPDYGVGLRWSRYGFDYAYQGNKLTSGAYFWALSIRY